MKKFVKLISLGIFALFLAVLFSSCATTKTPEASEDPAGFKKIEVEDMSFSWKIEGEELRIILTAPGEGWVAVGFDPGFIMEGADLKLARVKDGSLELRDDYADGSFGHSPDTELGGSKDASPVRGEKSAEGTEYEFIIPLDSGDDYDRVLVRGNKHVVMLAYGETGDFGQKHSARYLVEIEL